MRLLQALVGAGLLVTGVAAAPARAQDVRPDAVVRLDVRPTSLNLEIGASADLVVEALNADGEVIDVPVRVSGPRNALTVQGVRVTALQAGDHELVATVPGRTPGAAPLLLRIPVHVSVPEITRIVIDDAGSGARLFAGTAATFEARALDAAGKAYPSVRPTWASSDASVASVDAWGNIEARAPGRAVVSASYRSVRAEAAVRVEPFPAGATLDVSGGAERARTGDVVRFQAQVRAADGRALAGVPVIWTTTWKGTEFSQTGLGAPGRVVDGAFVADEPGLHTVMATAGPLAVRRTISVESRGVVQELQVIGQGRSSRVRTTDLWPYEGRDGRDYMLTGAKMSDGYAFIWDITDPSSIVRTDSIQIDARSINDVKVSPSSRYGVLTREGASNRRNGVVILDLADPAHPTIASTFDEQLTGGVHNVFATDDYLYAVSNGDKYVIIDMKDIRAPRYVSEYDHPNARIHDVWIHDGLAFSAEYGAGIVVVDVGNGRWGGSPEHPVFVNNYLLPTGATHAVFPYEQESTGRYYIFAGDEIMNREGLANAGIANAWSERYNRGSYAERYDPATGAGGVPLTTTGYIQIIDFTNPDSARMVARYEVPEYGTHNIWVEDDKLFQAYYEGGLRVVDVSGELMGNLYTQGREIAVFKSVDPTGYVANSTMVWSAIPYKGHIFFSDTNSGVWAVKLLQGDRPVS